MTAEEWEPSISQNIVIALRRAIMVNRMTQAGVCRAIGISQKHLSRIITGKVLLTTPIAVRLEGVLPGVDAEQLMALQAIEQVRAYRDKQAEYVAQHEASGW